MASDMELILPPPQQLLSPCQSPKPIDGSSENDLSHSQAGKPEQRSDPNPVSEDNDPPVSLLHIQEMLRKETSLVVKDNQNAMEDGQVAEDDMDEAHNQQDSHTINDNHPVENSHAMEGDLTMECQMLHAPEADTLPSIDNIVDQALADLQSWEPEEFEGDGIDVAEEDKGSCYEDDGSASSDNDHEHEAPQPNHGSAAEKTNNKKPRRKMASTAREYVARLHEKEDEEIARRMKQEDEGKISGAKRSRKRKHVGSDMGPSKTLKTADGNILLVSDGCSLSSKDDSLLPAESITARTHAEQMAQIIASIPQNCDTRRKTTQKQDLIEAKSIFGYKKVEAQDGGWKLKGMQTPMHNHQITAAAWMVKRELARMEPFGGILADAMGMGKTIMSLACIIGNQADDEHTAKFCKATLVVVPNKAIALQWEAEARRHWSDPFNCRVFIYDRQREDLQQLCTQSLIVLATYKELLMQYPENSVFQELAAKYGTDNISFHRELDKITGPLFRINWYRIILDEAHAIKNSESRTCCALVGKYRWALTGTPLSNNSEEMYPYMKFTQCDWTTTRREFLKTFFLGGEPNAEFEALTSLIMYRRTIDDSFLGRQIISLPERKETDLWVPISVEEECVVKAVSDHYKKMKLRCELGILGLRDLKDIDDVEGVDGTEEQQSNKNHRHKSATKVRSRHQQEYLLGRTSQVRQRQSTSHVFCIEPLLRQSFSVEQLAELRRSLEDIGNKGTILEQMQLGMKADDEISKYQNGLKTLQEREETFFGKCFDMGPLLDILGEECSVRDVTCLLCNTAKPPVEPVFSDIHEARGNKGTVDCPHQSCTKKLAFGPDIMTIQKIMEQAEDKSSGYREPAKDSWNVPVHHDDSRNGFFMASTFGGNMPILPSTKLTAAMAVVLTWMDEAPDDKILIFTQFRGTAKMLGLMLQTMDIGFVYFYGGLTPPQKARALDTIKTRDDIKVMVSTLKSGGQSLNLTVANRVIIIDPWWNKTAEQQAFGRVVRIGQEKVTHLVNIKTKEPIDRHIYTLQKMKAKNVDRTLQDDGYTPRPVSEVELQRAFLRRKNEKEKNMAAKAQQVAVKNVKQKNV
ncbi:SNF2 family N-terminal domain-containing protein [Trichoderma asperelloides]|nr:SNF2 family N-terminal domain-containing protein [Trichoderma asperelloides]